MLIGAEGRGRESTPGAAGGAGGEEQDPQPGEPRPQTAARVGHADQRELGRGHQEDLGELQPAQGREGWRGNLKI